MKTKLQLEIALKEAKTKRDYWKSQFVNENLKVAKECFDFYDGNVKALEFTLGIEKHNLKL